MKRRFFFLILGLVAGLLPARADGPDDQYINIYGLIQAGDALSNSSQPNAAFDKYLQAQTTLQQFQKLHPDWNPKIVNFRLNYLAAKIALVTAKGLNTPTATSRPPALTDLAPAVAAPNPVVTAEKERQIAALQETVQRLRADKSGLEAKLKEALAAQPTPLDPRELTKAQQQVRELMKEIDLLKSSLPTASSQPGTAQKTKGTEETKRALAEANRKLASQSELTQKVASENDVLQARIRTLIARAEAADVLRAENQVLKKQLAGSKPGAASPLSKAEISRQVAAAEARTKAVQADAEILRLEKIALENRIKTLSRQPPIPLVVTSNLAPPKSLPSDLARINLLEDERNDLAKRLDATNQARSARNGPGAGGKPNEELNRQIATLRARLETFEARAVPYTAEELALFQKPLTLLSATTPDAGKKSLPAIPSGTAGLVATAQLHFAEKEYDQAEADYRQILRRDERNAYALANVAAIQLERGHLADAEKNVKQALASAPDDAYSLSLLGYVAFRQEKYDEALDALSRAAKLDPQSAEIQNYLGVTLSHKGLRGPAEAALRAAITIDPNYASAHHNLAVIYLTQQPPLVDLARWHYEKAKAAGYPRNEEFEKSLASKAGSPPAR